jgi:hypothetical protein
VQDDGGIQDMDTEFMKVCGQDLIWLRIGAVGRIVSLSKAMTDKP